MGDIGRLDHEGYLYLTDRKSFVIISGGVNIYPQEVEKPPAPARGSAGCGRDRHSKRGLRRRGQGGCPNWSMASRAARSFPTSSSHSAGRGSLPSSARGPSISAWSFRDPDRKTSSDRSGTNFASCRVPSDRIARDPVSAAGAPRLPSSGQQHALLALLKPHTVQPAASARDRNFAVWGLQWRFGLLLGRLRNGIRWVLWFRRLSVECVRASSRSGLRLAWSTPAAAAPGLAPRNIAGPACCLDVVGGCGCSSRRPDNRHTSQPPPKPTDARRLAGDCPDRRNPNPSGVDWSLSYCRRSRIHGRADGPGHFSLPNPLSREAVAASVFWIALHWR